MNIAAIARVVCPVLRGGRVNNDPTIASWTGRSWSACVAAGLVAGLAAGPLIARARTPNRAIPMPGGPRSADQDEARPGLGRRSLDSLRVGVVVLDADDVPVLVNPAARAMGLLRAGGEPGHDRRAPDRPHARRPGPAHRRTPGGRARPAARSTRCAGEPLGVHLRAVALGGGFVAVEAADVTEAHRVARVRRDFVANVSHELKTPIGALQLLAEALLDATDGRSTPRPTPTPPRTWPPPAASPSGSSTSRPGSAGWSTSCSS